MQYTYEFEVVKGERYLIVSPFDFEGATQGEDWQDAALNASDWLRATIEHHLMNNMPLPTPTFDNEPQEDGVRMVVSVDAGLDTVRRVSASEAARILGVSPARITHMVRDGLLEAYKDGYNTWVTMDSIEARQREPRKVGRPKKAAI